MFAVVSGANLYNYKAYTGKKMCPQRRYRCGPSGSTSCVQVFVLSWQNVGQDFVATLNKLSTLAGLQEHKACRYYPTIESSNLCTTMIKEG